MQQWQRYLAELLGTFVLVFVGTTAIVGGLRSGIPPLLIAPFAFGLALLAGLYAFAEVSGGHYNPAVSIGLFLDRRIEVSDFVGYIIMQFVGATLASLCLLVATSKHDVAQTATTPAAGDGTAFLIELVFTAIFVTVILQSSKSASISASEMLPAACACIPCCSSGDLGMLPIGSVGIRMAGGTLREGTSGSLHNLWS